ncbi:MAG TPA: PQQ-binding-like beta-propeller repeat protein, partial [Planctomycetota bacterium]|nr:PQQ-binding-like beta-propeller repeat protein [Planctomycetota bacterium]
SKETGLLQTWPEGGPKKAWHVDEVGSGFGAVSVAAGRIFVLGDLSDAAYLLALDEKDGKVQWKSKLGPGRVSSKKEWQGPRTTPTVEGDRVYALGEGGDLACFEVATGKEIWRKHLEKDLQGEHSIWFYCDSPVLDGKQVVVKPGGKKGTLAGLDKATGEVLWRSTELTDAAEHTSLLPATIDGVKQYIVFTMENVAGVGADGKVLWKAPRKGDVAICTTPLYKDGIVLVGSSYNTGRSTAFKVTGGGGTFKAEQIYESDFANHHGGMVLVGDHVYGLADRKKGQDRNNADLKCMEFKTGKIVWQNESIGKGSITYADGHLILHSEKPKQGTVGLVEATPEGYKEKGRFAHPDPSGVNTWAYPVVANGRLYIRDGTGLSAYDVKK